MPLAEPPPPRRADVTLRFLAAPTDVGRSGRVSAGRVMEWIDNAGYACAAGWSGRYSVTAYVGNVSFPRPIMVGDLVEARAQLVHTGRTSMNILVSVSSGDPRQAEHRQTASCLMVFVALDEAGSPAAVPTWLPQETQAILRHEEAVRVAGIRKQIDVEMANQVYSSQGQAPRETLRFLAAPTDVNWGGKVHGGIVMRWIDEAAHVVATRWTGNANNDAVYTGGVRFYQPLRIGDLVEVDARLVHTGSKSMHVSVHVRSGDPAGERELGLTTHCLTVFVSVDAQGTPLDAPTWTPQCSEDRALDEHARHLIALRGGLPTQ